MARAFHFVIVDDDAIALLFLRAALERAFPQCRITEFCDGAQALPYIVQNLPDAIVTDYSMPRMNGVELILKLRDVHVSVPIVMVSNHPRIRTQALAAGATVFMDKGETANRLSHVMKKFIHPPKAPAAREGSHKAPTRSRSVSF